MKIAAFIFGKDWILKPRKPNADKITVDLVLCVLFDDIPTFLLSMFAKQVELGQTKLIIAISESIQLMHLQS